MKLTLTLPAALASALLLATCLGEESAVKRWDLGGLFQGGSNSLVAIAVGNAEGTRTVEGLRTSAYHGHRDPGNAKWNLGSFSYQHCSSCTPAQADAKQLTRLRSQMQVILRQYGGTMSEPEILNGIDLANQAPLAAMGNGAYPDRLKQAKRNGLKGADAITWARVWSYFDSNKQAWDAPGLGNQYDSIKRDQKRRQVAIEKVVKRNNERWSYAND
jgi:hypothetical protein